jgi:hypothetical protein
MLLPEFKAVLPPPNLSVVLAAIANDPVSATAVLVSDPHSASEPELTDTDPVFVTGTDEKFTAPVPADFISVPLFRNDPSTVCDPRVIAAVLPWMSTVPLLATEALPPIVQIAAFPTVTVPALDSTRPPIKNTLLPGAIASVAPEAIAVVPVPVIEPPDHVNDEDTVNVADPCKLPPDTTSGPEDVDGFKLSVRFSVPPARERPPALSSPPTLADVPAPKTTGVFAALVGMQVRSVVVGRRAGLQF